MSTRALSSRSEAAARTTYVSYSRADAFKQCTALAIREDGMPSYWIRPPSVEDDLQKGLEDVVRTVARCAGAKKYCLHDSFGVFDADDEGLADGCMARVRDGYTWGKSKKCADL